MADTPTIKGIFVNSHINALRDLKGEGALRELKNKFGRSIEFKNLEDVPIRDEVNLIECILDLVLGEKIPSERRSFEAGRLHFKDFTATALGKIIFSLPALKSNFKFMMMRANNIAGHVFRGVVFESNDTGPNQVEIIMNHNDYPIDHFRGLFSEWMAFAGYNGEVKAEEIGPGRYKYSAKWK